MQLTTFEARHIGPNRNQSEEMLNLLGLKSIQELIGSTVPDGIRSKNEMKLDAALSERDAIEKISAIAKKNQIFKSFIGMGYVDTIVPTVILRNVLENPGWYTQYTPYQAEISQGRLEALLNFQTMIMDFTGLEISNASLLDEGTAAAEAMAMAYAIQSRDASKSFLVASDCHPQTIAVVQTRAKYMGIKTVVADPQTWDFKTPLFGALLQYPNTFGDVYDHTAWIKKNNEGGALSILACDLMALALLKSPGELGADMAVGNTQCFGVPMGFGGPHAAFLATKDAYKRQMPGRIVGLSKDAFGKNAVRLALQTREQHIRRDKATSNICTAQVLLAIMSSMYAVYHGPTGVRAIASQIHQMTIALSEALKKLGLGVNSNFFNTLRVTGVDANRVHQDSEVRAMNFRKIDAQSFGITLDETTTTQDLNAIIAFLSGVTGKSTTLSPQGQKKENLPPALARVSSYLTHPVFNTHRSETEMLRYISKLQSRDLSLAHSMIPLGSCTMKLNATTEMLPVTWPEFSKIHPFCS